MPLTKVQPEVRILPSPKLERPSPRPPDPVQPTTLSTQNYANYLKPIEAPLVFNGFSEETVKLFATQFASAGVVPVMGAGSVSDAKQPEPLEPGSAISAILVRGDMDIAATCTVTYIDPQRLLACGHPLLQFGSVDLPMNKADVLATLPSPLNAFKIVNTTEPSARSYKTVTLASWACSTNSPR